MQVVVRAATVDDLEDILAIHATPGVIFGTLQIPYQTPELWRGRLAQSSRDNFYLAAERDGRVVGVLGLHLEPGPRRKHVASLGMSVHQDFQGQGIGRALMNAALDLADNWLNIHRLELQVYADNEPAVHLYQSCGFAIEGTLRDYAFRQGRYVDACFMARLR